MKVINNDVIKEKKSDLPIGTILPFFKDIIPNLVASSYWVECDGNQINDASSPLNGTSTPNLNGSNLMLSGSCNNDNSTIGNLKHNHTLNTTGGDAMSGSGTRYSGAYHHHSHSMTENDNDVSYFDVVYLLKIK